MKSLSLTLIASSLLALSACSSKGSDRYPTPVENKTSQAQKLADKRLAEIAEKEKALNTLKEKHQAVTEELANLKNSLAEQSKKTEALTQEKQALETKLNALETELATTKQALIKAQQEADAKKAEEAEKTRELNNQAEIKKGFADKGYDSEGVSYVSGGMIMVEGDTLKFQDVSEQSKNLNQLVIDGKTITLFDQTSIGAYQETDKPKNETLDINQNGVTGKIGSLPTRKLGDDFAQLRFGYLTANSKTTLFVQGHQTPVDKDMKTPFNYYQYATNQDTTDGLRKLPTEKAFDYKGYAFYGKAGNYSQFDVNAVVDFSQKKVKVELQNDGATALTFGGNIEGNTFAGDYQGITTKGAFYGTNGRDIGGLFYQTQGTQKGSQGVFGATIQGCGYSSCDESETSLTDFVVQ